MQTYTKKRASTKRNIILICLIMLIFSLFGLMMALLSDVKSVNVNVGTGFLNISGTFEIKHNGVVSGNSVTSVLPGDHIEIRGTIQNEFEKAIWVREVVTLSVEEEVASDILVYDFYPDTENETEMGNNLTLTEGVYATTPLILNGKDDQETVGMLPGSLNGHGSDSYDFTFFFYFSPELTNTFQDTTFSLSVATQALQYGPLTATAPGASFWEAVGPAIS